MFMGFEFRGCDSGNLGAAFSADGRVRVTVFLGIEELGVAVLWWLWLVSIIVAIARGCDFLDAVGGCAGTDMMLVLFAMITLIFTGIPTVGSYCFSL